MNDRASTDAFADHAAGLPRMFDPARAERTLEALGSNVAGLPDAARAVFASAFGNSPYLARLALRERLVLRDLWNQGPAVLLDRASRDAACTHAAGDMAEAMAILRRAKRQAALAIALADLSGLWDIDIAMRELTRFADASIAGALRFLLREAATNAGLGESDPASLEADTGLVVLAMGKAGAFELNYSSDIDLVVFYDSERFPFRKKGDARAAAVDLVKGLAKLLGDITSDGYVFRVDLRLRPDAGATQIAISTEAAERYYEEMGQNWERAAYIKARPCAGDIPAGQQFLKRIEPFVWRRHLDYAAIEDIHSIKRQIHAHGGHGAISVTGHNLKLGAGGIREIEFFAQTQQLILGGRNPSLRHRRTLDAIAALQERGLVSEEARAELSEAYQFLRRLEHRLQMIDDEQTHAVPKSAEGVEHLSCFCGFANATAFGSALTERLRCVQSHYANLFEKALPLGGARGSLVFTGVEDDPETIDSLRAMGFRDPHHAACAIRNWHHGRIRATRSARARELLTRLMPALLDALASTADADAAFAQFDRFVSRVPAGVQLFSLFLAHPRLLRLIASICGSAPRLADHLGRSPAILDAVLDPGFLAELPPRETLTVLFEEQLAAAGDHEFALNAARRFAREQMFRVGVQLIEGRTRPDAAGAAFANIADCVIAGLLERVERELAASAGRMHGGEFSVVAMGKLGGREMTVSSDLDLVFIYDTPEGVERSRGAKPLPVMAYYARFAQRLISALTVPTSEGGLYEVDMRLRPSGNKGPAAVSLESFVRYQTHAAWTWERLALTRARTVAGSAALRARIESIIDGVLQKKTNPAKLVRDARDMREKLAAQFQGRTAWDLKFRRGALIDIEFIVQTFQLRHASDFPRLRDQNTLGALEKLAAMQLIDHRAGAKLLDAATLQLALLQVLRLCVDGIFDPSAASEGMKALLVRAAGADNFDELEKRLEDAQRNVRVLFEKLLPA
ncbi:MAG TPA: bifunctional [glutamine synthetase] adenylyltransferase/[glutamine synthetase]-adenylyl-L-tyrosine phosphorylase [Rhizomicrobium sp.]|jgi:glutamate-ammonia-ligase adenylyltransferase